MFLSWRYSWHLVHWRLFVSSHLTTSKSPIDCHFSMSPLFLWRGGKLCCCDAWGLVSMCLPLLWDHCPIENLCECVCVCVCMKSLEWRQVWWSPAAPAASCPVIKTPPKVPLPVGPNDGSSLGQGPVCGWVSNLNIPIRNWKLLHFENILCSHEVLLQMCLCKSSLQKSNGNTCHLA